MTTRNNGQRALYVHLLTDGEHTSVTLPISEKLKKAHLLLTGENVSVRRNKKQGTVTFTLPVATKGEADCIIKAQW